MNTVGKVDKREAALGEGRQPLEVLLAYEDFSTALRAKAGVRAGSAPAQAGGQVPSEPVEVRSSARALLERAADEATKADIVFLSAHGQSELPVAVNLWFNQWLACKGGPPRALAVSLDPSARDHPAANQMLEGLRAAARSAGVELLLHLDEAPQIEWESCRKTVHGAAAARTALPSEVLHRAEPHPPWESSVNG